MAPVAAPKVAVAVVEARVLMIRKALRAACGLGGFGSSSNYSGGHRSTV